MPKNELARFVLNIDDGKIYLDGKGKVHGRGANLTYSLETFDKAVESGAFDRAFKRKVDRNELKDLRKEFIELIG